MVAGHGGSGRIDLGIQTCCADCSRKMRVQASRLSVEKLDAEAKLETVMWMQAVGAYSLESLS
jgi:hypothetical protein